MNWVGLIIYGAMLLPLALGCVALLVIDREDA